MPVSDIQNKRSDGDMKVSLLSNKVIGIKSMKNKKVSSVKSCRYHLVEKGHKLNPGCGQVLSS